MRIAFFSEVYWPMVSGVSLTLKRTVDALQARGHVVRVYSATYPLPAGMGDRPEVFRSPSRAFFVAPEVQVASVPQAEVTADLAAFQPDVVHILTEWNMGRRGLKAARELNIPVVMSAHTDYERYAKNYGLTWLVQPGWAYLRWFYRHAHKVLAPTRQYERHLHERGVWHTGIWTRGVNASEFSPSFRSEAFRAQYGVGADDVLVTYVGRLAPEKNIDVLLNAWELLGERRRGAKLLLTGEGLADEEVRRRNLADVFRLGHQHGVALGTAYASADVYAFASVTETFGNSLLEAMASSLPSVVAASGGVLEFAEDGKNSLLAKPNSAEHFADQLARLIADATLRRTLGAGAMATAAARHWDSIFDTLVDDYHAASRTARTPELVIAA
jgi:glycosyltransferase involved in cell wall biosynthesis